MEFGHFFLSGFVGSVDLHFPIKAIVQQKVVGHAYPVGFHGMALSIVVVSNVTFKKIEHLKNLNIIQIQLYDIFNFTILRNEEKVIQIFRTIDL